MTCLRRVLGPLATIWLIGQVATLTVALPVFWVQLAGAGALACTCSPGADSTCPIHHKTSTGSKLCLMRSADDSGAWVLSSLLSAVGLIPTRTATAAPNSVGAEPIIASSATTDRPVPPDPPPPRA
jgi:hypothetical protein